jgi:hypothetical protein
MATDLRISVPRRGPRVRRVCQRSATFQKFMSGFSGSGVENRNRGGRDDHLEERVVARQQAGSP